MMTVGIDLSSAKEGTVACAIEWSLTSVVVRAPVLRCDDPKLDQLICSADVVGIDAPFGWPQAFVSAITNWRKTEWSKEVRQGFQFRMTDLYVREKLGIWPLSVSTDRIALPAMRANALLTRHGVKDRSGDGKFFEVYPAASLKCWNLTCRGYKLLDPECLRVRQTILRGLRKGMPWLEVSDEYVDSSDALDSLVASLAARVAALGLSEKPPRGCAAAAKREGWIHLSKELPKLSEK